MAKEIDARGLSCPQPMMLVKKAIDTGENEIVVIADDAVAVSNVKRLAENYGYSAEIENKGTITLITLNR